MSTCSRCTQPCRILMMDARCKQARVSSTLSPRSLFVIWRPPALAQRSNRVAGSSLNCTHHREKNICGPLPCLEIAKIRGFGQSSLIVKLPVPCSHRDPRVYPPGKRGDRRYHIDERPSEKPDFETASFDGQSATAAAISDLKRQEWRYSEDQTGTVILGGR
jgi:hypothetical protein